MTAAALIDWNALGKVVLYALVAGICVPAVFALVIRGAARSSEAPRGSATATAYALASAVGGLICLGAVGFGIWLMTQK